MHRKTKAIVLSSLAVVTLFTSISINANQEGIKILVNDKELGTEAKNIDDRVYVPIRAVSEALGADVKWDGENNKVLINSRTEEDIIPEVLKTIGPSIVGIIGSINDDSEYSSKFKDLIAHGTGVIVAPDGMILTNAHVVKDMAKIAVILTDGSGYEAELKSIDEEADLALIKIQKIGLQAAKFGSQEDIISGKTVLAIGTPVSFTLRNSASKGIISGYNRGIDSSYKLIQTDAAINPGNSGGPLVNLKGEVIGINSSKFSGSGIEGLGFSIPVDTVKYVMDHFNRYGKVRRPYIGAYFEEDWPARIGLPSNSGLKILKYETKSPPKDQGLKEEDTIMSINDVSINTIIDFNEEMKKYMPKDKVTMKIKRDGIVQSVSIILGEK